MLPTIRHFEQAHPHPKGTYGLLGSFNETFRVGTRDGGSWHSPGYYGLEQGPVVLMIENHRSGFLWNLMKHCPYLVRGLRRAGFAGGWLAGTPD